ncbi:MAG: flagellar basal body P-ring protein FlgI, partial [Candidatus Hydrogenedentota bacterium]
MVSVYGIRENQLIGYGLVTGLAGKGDSRNSASNKTIVSLLKRYGVEAPLKGKYRNTAAVMVTASLPPFVSSGEKIDVHVSALGDAKSLNGGVLLQTPLYAANGQVYAVAQGVLLNPEAAGNGIKRSRYSFTGYELFSGRDYRSKQARTFYLPAGAIVEKEVPTNYVFTDTNQKKYFELVLKDFSLSHAYSILQKIQELVNEKKIEGIDTAYLTASGRIRVQLKQSANSLQTIASLLNTPVSIQPRAKVIIDSKTGFIFISGDVMLDKAAFVNTSS